MKKILWIFALLLLPLAAQAQEITSNNLTQVQPEYVCMVNDRLFPNVQIPVQYNGKTYYGCCPMCKERLANDPAMRRARDPVTGVWVDKADAVIGAKPDGTVLYFKNIENLKHYK